MAVYLTKNRFTRRHIAGSYVLRPFDYLVILICLILIPSAVVHSLLGVDEKAAFASLSPLIIVGAIMANRFSAQKSGAVLCFALTTIGIAASIVADSDSQILMGATLSVAIVAGHQLFLTLTKREALKIVSWFTFALLAGGLVGMLYAYFVKQPLLELRVGYRTTYLYLTTFSFAEIGNFVRPSGIFDEPGALAMYAAMVSMFNDMLRQNRILNIAIVSLLIFTGSLAGLLVVVLYFLASNSERSFRKTSLVFIVLSLGGYYIASNAFPTNSLTSAIDTFYGERLQIVDGKLIGDNRSNQVAEFFSLVDEDIILRGQKAATKGYYFEDLTSNPFSITFGYGLIISLPYFALLVWLVVITFRNRFRNSYTSLGLLFLLLQRPYIYHMSWSILIASAVWLLYYSSYNQQFRRPPLFRGSS